MPGQGLVKYEGPLDPPTTPFDTRRQAVYLYNLERGQVRSRAARNAGVRLSQVNSLRRTNEHFRDLEAASLEAGAEPILDSMQSLAEQGDVKAAQIMLANYFMTGSFGQQQPGSVVNNTLILETGSQGVREALEALRKNIESRVAELGTSPS